jgi:hypothetical protein
MGSTGKSRNLNICSMRLQPMNLSLEGRGLRSNLDSEESAQQFFGTGKRTTSENGLCIRLPKTIKSGKLNMRIIS